LIWLDFAFLILTFHFKHLRVPAVFERDFPLAV